MIAVRIIDINPDSGRAVVERPMTDDDYDDEGHVRIHDGYVDHDPRAGTITESWSLSDAVDRWPSLIPHCDECGSVTGCDCVIGRALDCEAYEAEVRRAS
jgi:hypothetical protein